MAIILVLSWTEHERGWGQRPDGISLHVSQEALTTYVDAYWKRQPKDTPNEYEAPGGPATAHECDDSVVALVAQEKGLRLGRGSYNLTKSSITLVGDHLLHDAQAAMATAQASVLDKATPQAKLAASKPSL